MGIRTLLHARPVATIVVCIIAALVAVVCVPRLEKGRAPHYTYPGFYYSADDGQTWVAGRMSSIPPFQQDGREWVRACIYSCAGKKSFCAYLEKYTPEVHDEITGMGNPAMVMRHMEEIGDRGLLIKRPGDAGWIPRDASNPDSTAITEVVCPDNQQPAKELTPDDWHDKKILKPED